MATCGQRKNRTSSVSVEDFIRREPGNLSYDEIARYLAEARDALKPTQSWGKYMDSKPFGLSRPSINRYVRNHEAKHFPERLGRPASTRVPVDDVEALLQELILHFHRLIRRVPPRERIAFFKQAAAMMTSVVGMGHVSVSAVQVPENFHPRPLGRPRDGS